MEIWHNMVNLHSKIYYPNSNVHQDMRNNQFVFLAGIELAAFGSQC